MSDRKVIMETYGIDYEDTMRRFMGNIDMYLKFLNKLPADDNMSRLGEAVSAGDLDRAFEAAHTLKGVSGNLGLKPLYEAVSQIVEPLRRKESRDDYPMLVQQVRTAMSNMLDMVEELNKTR